MRHRLLGLVALLALLTTCTAPPPDPSPVDGGVGAADEQASPPPDEGPQREPGPATLVMWARDGLPPEVASRAGQLPGVVIATHVRSATLGLVAARQEDGASVTDLDDGWRIPVEVLAVTPAEAARTMREGPYRRALAALSPGEVLLSASSAERRQVGKGGRIELVGHGALDVVGVVADGTLGDAEVITHTADAEALGLESDGSVLLAHDGRRGAGFTDRLEHVAPQDTAVRVVGARSDEEPRRASLVLGLDEVKDRFGEFAFRDDDPDREVWPDPEWLEQSIVVEEVPILGRVRCHRAIFDDLRRALQTVVDAGLQGQIDPAQYGGCYHPRRIGAGSESLSRHSWGIAIDINVDFSEPGMGPPPDPRVVEAFADAGFRWGGLFLSPDNHHFEWVGERATTQPPPAGQGETPTGTDS